MPDADAADVIVLIDGDAARRSSRPATPRSSRIDTIDSTRRYARVRADGGEALAGDAAAGVDRVGR